MKWCYQCKNYDYAGFCDKLKTKKKTHSRGDKCEHRDPIQEILQWKKFIAEDVGILSRLHDHEIIELDQ